MAQFTKGKLSASTNGLPIKITETELANAQLIHTAVNNETDFDEVWIWVNNNNNDQVLLTLVWGTEVIEYAVAEKEGLKLIVPGLVLQNAKQVKAFASDELIITGFINKITN